MPIVRSLASKIDCSAVCGYALACVSLVAAAGCGATKSYTATEQLLLSDAVDATVAKLDFTPLRGKRVYLDTTFLKSQRSPLLIDSDYVIGSLRQQMVGTGVLLVDGRDEAELIAEARIGALGADGHTVTYGLPASNTLSTASSVFANAPILPTIPEISLARHERKLGAAKIAVFAYERESREPYWQSGIAASSSNARDTWVLGVGPFQKGTIYDQTRFAGGDVAGVELFDGRSKDSIRKSDAYSDYKRRRLLNRSKEVVAASSSQTPIIQVSTEDSAN